VNLPVARKEGSFFTLRIKQLFGKADDETTERSSKVWI
jgi:hypothetical protein